MEALEATIAANLEAVRGRIAQAARSVDRDPASVRLIAVSKTFGMDAIQAAAAAGQRDFGENKVQEGLQKIAAAADANLRWHLIGHLQSNKARKAAAAFSCIHSVDSVDLLRKLDAAAADQGARPDLLVQVDLAHEATKYGAPADDLPAIFAAARDCRAARVVGLMVLPPWSEDPEVARPYFRQLRQARDRLAGEGVDRQMLSELSMGMSHDLETAIEEGATMVRVGTAIFGRRTPHGTPR